MFFTIYKITNVLNSKIYIGKHQTKHLNDRYMGSGKHIRRAIAKYGIENFHKEIIFQFDNEDEMNAKEYELVTQEFCLREDTYNLCPGGKGGFGYINKNRDHTSHNQKLADNRDYSLTDLSYLTEEHRNKKSEISKRLWKEEKLSFIPNTTGHRHSETTKEKMRNYHVGSNNSQYGTMWITDGNDNKKVLKEDLIPDGWYKGRVTKNNTG